MTKNNPEVFLRAEAALGAAPKDASVIALLRHGEKEPPRAAVDRAAPADASHLDAYDRERLLTERGKTDATMMGRLLFGRVARIEHSDVARCRQTAEFAAGGAEFTGGLCENPDLAGGVFFGDRAHYRQHKEAAGGYGKLMSRLAAGESFSGMPPLRRAAARFVGGLFAETPSGPPSAPGVNLCISHDGVLYLMLSAIGAEVAPFSEEQICYLEPLFLWKEDGKIFFHYRKQQGECHADFCKLVN